MQKERIQKTFQAEKGRLLQFISNQLANIEEAEDLVQDIFVNLLSNLNALEAVDNLTAWLYTVARNKIIDRYRKRRLPVVHLSDQENHSAGIENLTAIIPDTWDDLTREMVADEIALALDELPDKQRTVFVENEINGRTFKELAAESGESINTLLARKRYATKYLQARLQEIKKVLEE